MVVIHPARPLNDLYQRGPWLLVLAQLDPDSLARTTSRVTSERDDLTIHVACRSLAVVLCIAFRGRPPRGPYSIEISCLVVINPRHTRTGDFMGSLGSDKPGVMNSARAERAVPRRS